MSLADLSDELLEKTGLYELLRRRGIRLHSASQNVGARIATAAEARSLNERRGAALLWMQRTTFDDAGSTVEYGSHLYAASRYHFEFSFLAP
jgi:DNA-binding GntR family transcriptional regulator